MDITTMADKEILRKIVQRWLSMFKDRDDRHRATNSPLLWIDLSSQYNQGLVGIMVDFEVRGEKIQGRVFHITQEDVRAIIDLVVASTLLLENRFMYVLIYLGVTHFFCSKKNWEWTEKALKKNF